MPRRVLAAGVHTKPQAGCRQPAVKVRVVLALVVLGALFAAGVAGGLLRAGVPLDGLEGALIGRAALGHAALLIGGFFGTVIGLERALALRSRLAFAAPLASASAGIALLAGAGPDAVAPLLLLAGLQLTGANLLAWYREPQPQPQRVLALAAALAWTAGTVLWAAGARADASAAWWFAFLIATIVAERIGKANLVRGMWAAQGLFFVAPWVLLAAGAAAMPLAPRLGGVLYGTALLGIACWLLAHGSLRHALHVPRLARYAALCESSGDAWLGLAGLAWAVTALGIYPLRDAALHALALGFVGSMLMGHAPRAMAAMARLPLVHGPLLYAPAALLQASLLLRLGPGSVEPAWRATGAALNAAALALFVLAMLAAALAAWWHATTR
jgi:hypothetical protein